MKTLLNILVIAALIATTASAEEKSCCKKPLAAAAPLPDKSLYQVTSSWTNDASAPVTLTSLRGKPQIVTMFFASCEFACPLLVNDMKRIEAALPENVRTNVGFVLISFDTERDTPPALAKFRTLHKLNSNWTLLRGGTEDVLEISALLGVKYKRDARGQFAHSNLITLLNPNGEVVTQQIGLNQSGADIVNQLAAK
jgi:protein SCO1